MDGLVERGDVCEGLVGEVMGLKIAPDRLDVVEFGRVFRQPLDGEPVCAGGQGGERAFAGVDRTIVLDQHDRFGLSPGAGSESQKTYPLVNQAEFRPFHLWPRRLDSQGVWYGVASPI